MRVVLVSCLAVCASFGQGAPEPSFEVASIKRVSVFEGTPRPIRMDERGRLNYATITLKQVMARAYQVQLVQINGPAWLDTERFDIQANYPEGIAVNQIHVMLRRLIEERFQMTVHREMRTQPIYALLIGSGGPKLAQSTERPEHAAVRAPGPPPPPLAPGATAGRVGRMEIKSVSMNAFAGMLSYVCNRHVADMTGLPGEYDISIPMPIPNPPVAGPDAPVDDVFSHAILTGVEKLGLKLEPRKAPVEYVVVDKATRIPTGN